jgi:hypothetical protein
MATSYRTSNNVYDGGTYWVYTQMGKTNQLYLAVLVEKLDASKQTANVIICGNGTRLTIPFEDLKTQF